MKARVLLAALALTGSAAFGQAPEKPKTYALISAIGSEITYVRQVKGVGSNISPYRRTPLQVADGSIDAAVLRGLDRAVAQDDPDSKRVFLRLAPGALKGIAGYQRGDVMTAQVLSDLEFAAERKDWDRIILVTPRFANMGSSHMGDRLHGIGVYVQPLGRNLDSLGDAEIQSPSDPETFAPDGTRSTSYRFVAPYFYAQIWVVDAKTLKVLEKNERYDFMRFYDPMSTAIDVGKSIPPEVLAQKLESFVERASAKALNEAIGEVIVKEPKIVNPATK
ncbi:MAG TPA: hypothetical protein VM051_03675 [Usitatibacter sp.]|nr:hypothetical protein [Usitatibacter sp.]